MTYNPQMDHDEALDDFLQILARIKDLVGEATISDDAGIDLVKIIEQLRQSGKNDDADELAELIQRADKLKARHQATS